MSFTIYPNQHYESMMEFYERGSIFLQINERLFFKEDIKSMEQHDFEGIFYFVIETGRFKRKWYKFVALTHGINAGHYYVQLAPLKMEDEGFAKYFHATDEVMVDEDGYTNYWMYQSYNASAYQTNPKELVDFYGNVRPIKKDDIYVTDNEINYQVCTDFDYPTRTKKDLEKLEFLESMENDCFMGKFIIRYGYNTGEVADDVYTIKMVDDEVVYLEPCTLRNNYNMPHYINLSEEEGDVTIVRAESHEFYIPYKKEEDVTKTPTLEDVVSSYKSL